MTKTTYEVYLSESERTDSPVRSDRLDFYDSGVWVQVDEGREFYPYGRIRKIREVEDGQSGPTGGEEETETEPAELEYGE